MGVDIFASRRDSFEKCLWWDTDMSNEDDSELVMKLPPTGIFYAKEVSPETMTNNTAGGVFMYDSSTITLRSSDDLFNMRQNALVVYNDEKWIVDSLQKQQFRKKSSEFAKDKNVSHFWFIRLRKY